MGSEVGFTAPKFAMLSVTSLITMIHAAKVCADANYCRNERGWAVACSVVSLVVCIAYLVVFMFVKGKQDFIPAGIPMKAFSAFMLCWWTAGVGVMTFDAPFNQPSNGYFGAWMSFFICAVTTYSTFPQLSEAKGVLAQAGYDQLGLLLAGLVLLIQGSKDCSDTDCEDEWIWGVICGVLTFLIACVLIALREKLPGKAGLAVVILQCLFWVFGWGVLTYRNPYVASGNGYFACFAGLLLSLKVALKALELYAPVEQAIDDLKEEATPEADAEQPENTGAPF